MFGKASFGAGEADEVIDFVRLRFDEEKDGFDAAPGPANAKSLTLREEFAKVTASKYRNTPSCNHAAL